MKELMFMNNTMLYTERINTIKLKLERLKQKDTKLEIFGAGDNALFNILGHHYKLRDVLAEEKIRVSEELAGVTLPLEYREFLKQIGDGGPGPGWGMYELLNTHPDREFFKEYPDACSMEFPYPDSYAEGILGVIKGDLYHRGPFDDYFGGYIKLAHYGHDMYAILVVSGEQYGKMWLFDEGNSITPFYQDKNGVASGVTFLDWFENWLDDGLEPKGCAPQF